MKAVNLLSLVNAKKDLPPSVFELYLENFAISPKEDELDDIGSFVNQLLSQSQELEIFNEFYIGYSISQISKEFDLLRFGQKNIINIELKNENTGERIKKQLVQNKYYLSFLGKEILNFTYVAEDKKLFYLENNINITEVDFSFLISKLSDQILEEVEDINKLFNPSNYLISPFNSTEAFIQGQYFLTHQQERYKNDILKLSTKDGPRYISIQGSAGTGKTLLTYDIAKEYINNKKKVLIFHCGSLNNGHHRLRANYSWSIAPIKSLEYYDLSKYDLIIVDEVQRIYKNQIDELLNSIKETNIKCIFSYDSQQCLARWEIERNIPQYITAQVSPMIFTLTEKIRSNKEIASFIKCLFDLYKNNIKQEYSNVNIQYFSNAFDAQKYIAILSKQGWKVINYTPSRYNSFPYDKYQNSWEDTAHAVIGQEYDSVVAVIDKYFYYNQDGKLSTRGWNTTPYYHPTKMLFQIVTRTRKKLTIVIINNKILLDRCLKVLQSNNARA